MGTQRISVCQVDELSMGEMKQFSVGDKEILLARPDQTDADISFTATTAHCSHYGAPLEKGVMHGTRVVCPWHNACYNIASGAQLQPPGRDNLKRYPVHIENGTVYVELPEAQTEAQSSKSDRFEVPLMAEQNTAEDSRRFVIVGGGAAGAAAAERLREVCFQGEIVVLSADDDLPYDRTKLSKAALQQDDLDGPDLLRAADFYKQHNIDVRTSALVTKIDAKAQEITYSNTGGNSEKLEYDMLLIATGGKVRKLPIEGSDLENVFTIRKVEDTQHILAAAKEARRAVIVGSGFIGMEAASSLRQKGLAVTVVTPDDVPFKKVLGKQVGKLFQQVHESEGVVFKLGQKAKALKGNGKVDSVELDSGETLPADLVIVGIGVTPATDFVEGIALDDDDKSVLVNQYLEAAPNVYAAGDIAQFPHFATGEPVRIEHWRLAMQHGRVAAANMMGQTIPFEEVPFFWSGQFDMKLRYVGHSENYDEVAIQGSLEDKKFLAFYIEKGQAMAVAGVGRDRDIAAISELMRMGEMPTASDAKKNDMDWASELSNQRSPVAA